MKKLLQLFLISAALVFTHFASDAEAFLFLDGNLLVTHNNTVNEYTLDGALIDSIKVPHPTAQFDFSYTIGDVIYDSSGNIHVTNFGNHLGNYISTYNPNFDTWTHTLAPIGLGNLSDGDLSYAGDYLYRRDAIFNVNTLEVQPLDIGLFNGESETTIGRNGLLYTINSGSPRYRIQKTDPETLVNVGPEFEVRDFDGDRIDGRGLAITEDGELFISAWDGYVYKYENDGELKDFLFGNLSFNELNLSSDGKLAAGSRFGDIFISDVSLNSFSSFNVGSFQTYSTFIEHSNVIPEPGTMLLFGSGMLGALAARRKRKDLT